MSPRTDGRPFLVCVAVGLAALVLAPLCFDSGFQLGLMSQMCAMALFALSYNLLLGQTGMLSFGHAVYAGLGGYAVIHLLRGMDGGPFVFPTVLLPVAGGVAGAAFAALIGYPTTRRGGTSFAMISLAVGELVHAAAGMLPEWFGGEGGLAADRTAGPAFVAGLWPGWSLGPDLHVYYLTAAWTAACAIAIHALGRTPLLKLANAVRDNPQRVAFIGYDPHRVRYLMLTLSGFFAGVAGGLMALNLEIASADSLGALRSGAVLLAVVVGGSGLFLGPVAGAVVVTFFSVELSRHTGAWQLYLGLAFAAVVLALPGGLAGGIRDAARRVERGEWADWLRARRWTIAGALAGIAGLSLAIELAYGRAHGAGGPGAVSWFGLMLDPSGPLPWSAAGMLSMLGAAGLLLGRGRSRPVPPPERCDG